MGKKTEALNSLLKGISNQADIESTASETGDVSIENEVKLAYDNIQSSLLETYGLSVSDANEILLIEDDTEYTKRIMAIAGE